MKRNRSILKRIFVMMICVCFIFSLCSCKTNGRYKKRDLDEKIIVHALGIDKTKNDEFEVTMQILAQQGSGSLTPIDPSQSNSATVSQIAKTIPSAIERCETDLGKKAFLGHSELILLGSSVDDLTPIMDFLVNTQGISLGIIMAYTDVTAKEILDIKITSGTYSAEVLKEAFKESEENGTSTECELVKHIDSIENTNGTTVLPIVKKIQKNKKGGESSEEKSSDSSDQEKFVKNKSEKDKTKAGNEKLTDDSGEDSKSDSSSESDGGEDSKSDEGSQSEGGEGSQGGQDSQQGEVAAFYIDGAVIVKNNTPKAVMTRDEVIGLCFLNNGISEQVINSSVDNISTAVSAGSVKKDTYINIQDGEIAVNIDLTVSFEFYKTYSYEQKQSAAKKAEEHIYSLCNKAIDKALKKESADIFEIDSLLNHNDYVLYKEYKKNPDEILKRVDIKVNINPQI